MGQTLVLMTFFYSLTLAAQDFGRQVEPYKNALGPTLSVGSAASGSDVLVTMSVGIWGEDLFGKAPGKLAAWRIWNKKTKQYVGDWEIAFKQEKGAYFPGLATFHRVVTDKSQVLTIVTSLTDLVLVFSVNGDEQALKPTHSLPLGPYCQSSPKSFVNMTTGRVGC